MLKFSYSNHSLITLNMTVLYTLWVGSHYCILEVEKKGRIKREWEQRKLSKNGKVCCLNGFYSFWRWFSAVLFFGLKKFQIFIHVLLCNNSCGAVKAMINYSHYHQMKVLIAFNLFPYKESYLSECRTFTILFK